MKTSCQFQQVFDLQPYGKFSWKDNPLFVVTDPTGVHFLDLSTKEIAKTLLCWKKETTQVGANMWSRFRDCLFCDQRAVANAQGLAIDYARRNVCMANDNKFEAFSYESMPYPAQLPSVARFGLQRGQAKGQSRLPPHLRK